MKQKNCLPQGTTVLAVVQHLQELQVSISLLKSEQEDAIGEVPLSSYLLPLKCLYSQVHHICSAPGIMFRKTEIFHSHVYNIFISQ